MRRKLINAEENMHKARCQGRGVQDSWDWLFGFTVADVQVVEAS
jgi:hypothetical protein